MADDYQNSDDHQMFDESLPLPEELKINHDDDLLPEQRAAADLIRQRVASAFDNGPNYSDQAIEAAELQPAEELSKHQQFIYDLTAFSWWEYKI
jgi:hypothetical protein